MERLLTAADAARILGVVPARVRQLAVEGQLVPMATTENGTRLFRRQDVEELAQARRAKRPGSCAFDEAAVGEEGNV